MKITLNNVGSLIDATTAQTTINNNNSVLETALENTLSRDGTSPNQMSSDFDMNSKRILNLPAPISSDEPLRYQDLSNFIGGGTVTNIPAGGNTNDVLTKASNANYDVDWSSAASEVAAGANISVTGASPATVATIQNPTFTTSVTTPSLVLNGTTLNSATGSGAVVLATSPTLVGPALGTPVSGLATNLSGTAPSLTAGHVTTNANMTGDVTSVGNATTLTNAPVIAKVLTGYTSGAGIVSATDSILSAIQKLNGNDATNANLTGDVTSVGNATTLATGNAGNLNSGTLLAARMPALTGDITTSAGAVATTLATVASAGTTGSSTAIPVVTINAKGLTTGITTAAVVAPAGTLSGATLNSGVTASSLTSFGTSPTTNTQAVDDNSTKVATTAYVVGQAASATPLINGTATVGTSTRFARGDHIHPTDTTRAALVSPSFTTPSLGVAIATTINGAALDNLAWTAYTPTITSQTGTPTTTTSTGRFKQIGKLVFMQVDVTITTIGTAAGGVRATLPVTAAAFAAVGSSAEVAVTGKSGACFLNGSATFVQASDATNTTYWVNGNRVVICLTYEAA